MQFLLNNVFYKQTVRQEKPSSNWSSSSYEFGWLLISLLFCTGVVCFIAIGLYLITKSDIRSSLFNFGQTSDFLLNKSDLRLIASQFQ